MPCQFKLPLFRTLSSFVFVFGLVTFWATPGHLARAADAPDDEAAAYAPRTLKFAESNLTYPVSVGSLEKKVAQEQWFVAVVQLEGAYVFPTNASNHMTFESAGEIARIIEATPKNSRPSESALAKLTESRSDRLTRLYAHVSGDLVRNLAGATVGESRDGRTLRALADKERRVNPDENRRIKTRGFYRTKLRFEFLAPTADEAKQLAEAFLVVYDQGFLHASRQMAKEWKRDAEIRFKENRELLTQANDQLARTLKTVEAATEPGVSAEVRDELNKRKVLLTVERVGALSRIDAIERKIALFEKRAPGSSPANIVALKEAAEIDLAGLQGQIGEIERLIRVATERQ